MHNIEIKLHYWSKTIYRMINILQYTIVIIECLSIPDNDSTREMLPRENVDILYHVYNRNQEIVQPIVNSKVSVMKTKYIT